MVILLSPAKTLDETPKVNPGLNLPTFRKETNELARILKSYTPNKIKELMHISDKLANLNHERYQNFSSRYTTSNSKAAIFAFKGDVYQGFKVEELDADDLLYAEAHLRILSGLYGCLKPLDKMQAYRLEMGTSLKTDKGNNLYDFWKGLLTKEINKTLKKNKNDLIINLASKEYFSALDKKGLKGDLIDIGFKEYRDGKLKFISFSAKKARGMMARYIVKERIEAKEGLKGFDYDGYAYDEGLSSDKEYMFVR